MAGLADGPDFDVVRRGYDIDQVHDFLVRQAEAWRAELYQADRRIDELQTDLVRLDELARDLERTKTSAAWQGNSQAFGRSGGYVLPN